MDIERQLEVMGLELPDLPEKPGGRRVRATRCGALVFLAGHGPYKDGGYPFKGPVPSEISVEAASEATRYNALGLLSSLKKLIGDLDRVEQILKLTAYVNGVPGFTQASAVAEGCSDLLMDLYGDRGRHTRSAVCVNGLGLNICCEIEMVVSINGDPTSLPTRLV